MSSNADNVLLTFPPRAISQWERALVAEWFAATQRTEAGIASAYVSERRGDDPMVVGRIVIVDRPANGPSHLIYSPAEFDLLGNVVVPHLAASCSASAHCATR